MADVKISQLPAATTPVDGTEVLPIVQSATTKQVSIANLTAGRAMSATSLTLTTPLAVTSGGTGLATTAQGTLLSSTALNTISATATPTLGVAGTTAGSLSLSGVTSGVVTINTAATAGTWSMTLPTSGGTNGYILTTNGSGVTSWTNPTALGVDLDVGGTAVTGGTDKYILYNNNGTLGNYAVTGTGTTAVMSTSPALSGNVTLDSATFSPSSPGTNGNMAMTGTLAMGSSFLRNRIINGGMQIWQRGTSGTASGYAYPSVDRWAGGPFSAYQVISQSSSVPSSPKFQYSTQVRRTTSQTDTTTIIFMQVIESVNCVDLSGQTITLSFYAKAGANFSASGSSIGTQVVTGTAADQGGANYYAWTGGSNAISTSVTLTTSWQKFTLSGTVGSGILEMAAVFSFTPTGTAGADDGFYITGVQLEVGSVATPFERRQYGTELALCQRYANYAIYGLTVQTPYISTSATGIQAIGIPQMRSAPSGAIYGSPAYSGTSGLSVDSTTTGTVSLKWTNTANGGYIAGINVSLTSEL